MVRRGSRHASMVCLLATWSLPGTYRAKGGAEPQVLDTYYYLPIRRPVTPGAFHTGFHSEALARRAMIRRRSDLGMSGDVPEAPYVLCLTSISSRSVNNIRVPGSAERWTVGLSCIITTLYCNCNIASPRSQCHRPCSGYTTYNRATYPWPCPCFHWCARCSSFDRFAADWSSAGNT